jgi:hypothetical protein
VSNILDNYVIYSAKLVNSHHPSVMHGSVTPELSLTHKKEQCRRYCVITRAEVSTFVLYLFTIQKIIWIFMYLLAALNVGTL